MQICLFSPITERFFYVEIGNVCSTVRVTWYGITQGSILGHVLYAIFVSPLFAIENLTCYADDNYSIEWSALNFNQILMTRQSNFITRIANVKKVGINILVNRLYILNGLIPLAWLKSGIEMFKIKCKSYSLPNDSHVVNNINNIPRFKVFKKSTLSLSVVSSYSFGISSLRVIQEQIENQL